MDFEDLHNTLDPVLELEIKAASSNKEPVHDTHTSTVESIKEIGVLSTIQDIKNPECIRFHLFSPVLTEAQDVIFLKTLRIHANRIRWASFESIFNIQYLQVLSPNTKYLKINFIDNLAILNHFTVIFKTNLANLYGLSIGISPQISPVLTFLNALHSFSSLLFLRLSGEFSQQEIKAVATLVENNKSLVYLGFHNSSIESESIYDILAAVSNHAILRTLDLEGTLTNNYFLKELADCIKYSYSLNHVILNDTFSLAGSILGPVLKNAVFLQYLDVTPDHTGEIRSMFKNSSIIGTFSSEDVVIHDYCRKNLKKQLLNDIRCQSYLKLLTNLKIFSPHIPVKILSKIARPFFTFFRDRQFEVLSNVVFDRSRTIPITSPFPFSAQEYLQRCYSITSIRQDFNLKLIESEIRNPDSPILLASLKRKEKQSTYNF